MSNPAMSTTNGEVLQYIRQCSCIIGTLNGDATEFSELRLQFQVRRGDFQTPNTLQLRIFNLSADTMNKVVSNYTQVQLNAGYPQNCGLIFQGTIKQFRRGRIDGKDNYLDISAADGDEAYNYAFISQSVRAGTPPSAVQALLSSTLEHNWGITEAYVPNIPGNGSARGQVFHGMVKDEMRKFANQNQLSWSIQDGQLVVVPLTSFMPGSVPLITPQSGLIGAPEQTQQGIRMKVLLNPNIRVAQLVKLDNAVTNLLQYSLDASPGTIESNYITQKNASTSASGLYYVMVANHMGDTRGNDWFTDLTCLAADASLVTESNAGGLTVFNPDATDSSTGQPVIPLYTN